MVSLERAGFLAMRVWSTLVQGLLLTGEGHQGLLARPMTAFFASRQCPGTAIRAAMDWALAQARAKQVVVSGFHSPLEQSVLKVLLAAGSPAVAVLARPVAGARLTPEWRAALEKGSLVVVSSDTGETSARRLTQQLATERNTLVAQLAQNLVVAHASPVGSLAAQVVVWRQMGRAVQELLPNAAQH